MPQPPDFKYYTLTDVKHQRAIAAGDAYDGRVYHQDAARRRNAEWCFVPARDGYFHLVDRAHEKAIAAGEAYSDGQLYHQDHGNRPVALWKVEPGLEPGSFIFTDAKYGKAIVAPDGESMSLYHQDAGRRRNAEWKLELAAEGRQGPTFLMVDEKVIALKFQGSGSVEDRPPLFSLDKTYENFSPVAQQSVHAESWSEEVSETFTFERELSLTLRSEISVTYGAKTMVKEVAESSIEVTATVGTERTDGRREGKSVTRTTILSGSVSIPVDVPPMSAVRMTCLISHQKRSISFVAVVERTFADGRAEKQEIHGVWTGAEVITGAVAFTPLPLS